MRISSIVAWIGLAAGCSDIVATQQVALRFDANVAGIPVGCETVRDLVSQANIGSPATLVQFADARMLVYRPQLRNDAGDWVDIDNGTAFPWRNNGVTLLDFEDDEGRCSDSLLGNPETNNNLSGLVPVGGYTGVRFTLGVPFELNHIDILRSRAPSFDDAMYVDVARGYRFTRIDFAVAGQDDASYRVDIGSQGCDSTDPDDVPDSCTNGNQATITLDDFVLGDDAITVDIGQLTASADLTGITKGETRGCSFVEEEGLTACAAPLEALGLSPDTGECVDECAGQTVFGVGPLSDEDA